MAEIIQIDYSKLERDATKISKIMVCISKEVSRSAAKITREYGKKITSEAIAMLPPHWFLRRDLKPAYTLRRGVRHVAGVSFKTKGERTAARPSKAEKPRKGRGKLLPLSTPRVYAVHHDRGNQKHRTKALFFLTGPLSRNRSGFLTAMAQAVDAAVKKGCN